MKHYFLPLLAVSAVALSGCTGKNSYQAADIDNNTRISPKEFDRYMLEAIYAEADTNGDSKVTLEEYMAANPSAKKANFKKVDANHDGVITPKEAKNFSDKEGTLTELFNQIDSNGDGALDKGEIEAFYNKARNASGTTKIEKLSNAATE